MRIGRTVPPAAAPLCWSDLAWAICGMFAPARALRAREEELRRYFGVPHVFLLSSGTAALTLALRSLKSATDRRRVVIPAYTCFSVPAAILEAGLQPVICDIDPTTFDFDYAMLERSLNEDTLCVVAHHLFGIPSHIERLRALCRPWGALVVEDAAQAMGIEANGRKLGTLGDIGVFSLGRGKQITCGSGGILVTGSDQVAEAIERVCRSLEPPSAPNVLADLVRLVVMAIFIRPSLYWIPATLPFLGLGQTIFPTDIPLKRLSGMHAGVLRNWRRRLHQSNQARAAMTADMCRQLSLMEADGPAHPYLRLPVLASTPGERARLRSLSQERGLGLSAAYPTPVNEIPEISWMFNGQRFPSARRVSERLLTIPTHHWVSKRDRQAIAECIGTATGIGRHVAERQLQAS